MCVFSTGKFHLILDEKIANAGIKRLNQISRNIKSHRQGCAECVGSTYGFVSVKIADSFNLIWFILVLDDSQYNYAVYNMFFGSLATINAKFIDDIIIITPCEIRARQ